MKVCEIEFAVYEDTETIVKIVQGFMQVVQRRKDSRIAMWRARAATVDKFARWTIPNGFFIFIAWLYSLDTDDLHNLMDVGPHQTLFTLIGVIPAMASVVA